jgi:hypothetical protein
MSNDRRTAQRRHTSGVPAGQGQRKGQEEPAGQVSRAGVAAWKSGRECNYAPGGGQIRVAALVGLERDSQLQRDTCGKAQAVVCVTRDSRRVEASNSVMGACGRESAGRQRPQRTRLHALTAGPGAKDHY